MNQVHGCDVGNKLGALAVRRKPSTANLEKEQLLNDEEKVADNDRLKIVVNCHWSNVI